MCFDIGADSGDLRISLSYKNAYRNAPQRVLLTVNGVSLGEIQSEEIIHVSGDLIKEDGLLKLHFDYPDATTSEEQTGGHGTYLRAVNYRWILIERDT